MIELLNITLFGQECVGKTSIINRFCKGIFVSETSPTMGSNSFKKKQEFQGQIFNLQIWDTSSQQVHRRLQYNLMEIAEVAILVFDFTRENTLMEIKNYWLPKLYKKNKNKYLLTILFGNKADKVNDKEKRKEWGQTLTALKKKYGCLLHYGSCLNEKDEGVEMMFKNIMLVIGDLKNRQRKMNERKIQQQFDSLSQSSEIKQNTQEKKQKPKGNIFNRWFKKKPISQVLQK